MLAQAFSIPLLFLFLLKIEITQITLVSELMLLSAALLFFFNHSYLDDFCLVCCAAFADAWKYAT